MAIVELLLLLLRRLLPLAAALAARPAMSDGRSGSEARLLASGRPRLAECTEGGVGLEASLLEVVVLLLGVVERLLIDFLLPDVLVVVTVVAAAKSADTVLSPSAD